MRGIYLFSILPLLSFECKVEVPPPSRDTPPVITIGVRDTRGKFSATYTADAQLVVDKGTDLVMVSSAFNSGGVKNHLLSFSSSSESFLRTSTPDSKGKVPRQLNIVSDNSGGAIHLLLNDPGKSVQVIATSENYNFMQSKITVSYTVAYPPPRIDYLKFTKRLPPNGNGEEDGYINLGQSTNILWNVENCQRGCSISLVALVAKDGFNYVNKVFELTGLSPQGSHQVTPQDHFTKYILTATNASGSAAKDVLQEIFIPH